MRTALNEYTWHTMDSMADDWESLDQIVPHVESFLGPTERVEVARLLIELVSDGLLREIEPLSHQGLTPGMILETPIEYWFAMTPEGRALWESEAPKYRDQNVA